MKATSQPAVFFGHGSPMNALERNRHTDAWSSVAHRYEKPKAILAVSAHWYVRGTAVTAMAKPPTIHDFGGFPPQLHAFDYPAPGDTALAARVRELLAPLPVRLDDEWGLDHGTWSVLAHVYPQADVPIVQLAIDGTQLPAFHYDLGRKLAPLRDEGIMLVGSGNVVHNLSVIRWGDDSSTLRASRSGSDSRSGAALRAHATPYPWAVRFNDAVRGLLESRNHAPLVDYHALGESARQSVPTAEHFLPALYIAGAQRDDDTLAILTDGIELGSISMLAFAYSAK